MTVTDFDGLLGCAAFPLDTVRHLFSSSGTFLGGKFNIVIMALLRSWLRPIVNLRYGHLVVIISTTLMR